MYACQASQARATQQVDEEGLNRIVYVVCYGYHRVAILVAQLLKPAISQTTCCHLHRLARKLHLCGGVETAVVALNAIFSGTLLHQYLVLVALRATQLEVAVCHAHIVAAVYAERHQYHRIHSARYGQQYLVLLGE